MFAQIAVDTYHDPTKKLFSYEIPKKFEGVVEPGDLVKVPFGKRMVAGFVYQISTKKPTIKTKPIKALKEKKVFTPNQIKLAQWLSNHYAAPPLECLKCQKPGKGERYTEGTEKELTTLLLVPYTTKVKLKALELTPSEKKTTLVGSRSAVFAPLPNLKRVIIEEPENWAYKEERSPYYHASDVAQKRAELEGLKVEKRYLIPRVDDFFREKTSLPKIKVKVKIVDLKKERDAGNFSPLSSQLTRALGKSKQALIYVASGKVKGGVDEAVRAQGLDRNRIEIAGPEIFAAVGKAYDTVSFADADTLLNLPSFRAHEKLVFTVAKLSHLTKDKIFIQTASPLYPLFKEIKDNNLKSFYQRELAARKPFLYPPFGVLAKLEFSTNKKTKVAFEAERLHKTLLEKLKGIKGVLVSPPYPPYLLSRGKAQLNITIKAKNRRLLAKVLAFVPSTWKIAVDPEVI